MKQTTKITVEYDLKEIQEVLAKQLSLEGFNLERIEPRLCDSGDDRFGPTSPALSAIVCHVTKKPPQTNYGYPYDK